MTASSERVIVLCADDCLCGALKGRLREALPELTYDRARSLDEAIALATLENVIGCVLCMPTLGDIAAKVCAALGAVSGERTFVVLAWMPPDTPREKRDAAFRDGVVDCIDSEASLEEISSKLGNAVYLSRVDSAKRAANEHLANLLGDRSREMRSSLQRYQCVAEAVSDMLFTVEANSSQHRILEANPAAAAFLSTSVQQLVGEPLLSYLPRESVDVLEGSMKVVKARKQNIFELTFQALDGSRYQRQVFAYAIDFGGEAAVLLVAAPRKQEYGSAGESGRFRLMATRTGQVVYELDVDQQHLSLGGAFMELTGYPLGDAGHYQAGRWQELIHPEDRREVMATYRATLQVAGKWLMEYRLRHKDGAYRHVEDTGVCIPGKDGRSARVIGTIKDVSHRIEAEENRRRMHEEGLHSQKLESLGVLAGGIAHDFNNILAAIIGLTALALRDIEEGTPLHEDLREVLQAGHRAKDLVRQILMFSRHQDTERVPVRLNLVAGEVLKLVRSTAPASVRIFERFDPDAGAVLANPAQMHQVIMNYCTNAIHAVRQGGGAIQIIVEPMELGATASAVHPRLTPGTWVRLAVIDDGHGMSEHVRQRIFDPFFTTKPPGEGTGMGLAVVHGIVSEHRGVVDVQSRPGSGTTFYTYFPAAAIPPDAGIGELEEAPVGVERVLIIIPEHMVSRFVFSTLKRLGYSVSEARNARAAIERLSNGEHFDAVIADTRLEDATPEQLLKALTEAAPAIRALLLAGPEEAEAVGALADDDTIQALKKPMSFEELARATRNVLDATRPVR